MGGEGGGGGGCHEENSNVYYAKVSISNIFKNISCVICKVVY